MVLVPKMDGEISFRGIENILAAVKNLTSVQLSPAIIACLTATRTTDHSAHPALVAQDSRLRCNASTELT